MAEVVAEDGDGDGDEDEDRDGNGDGDEVYRSRLKTVDWRLL